MQNERGARKSTSFSGFTGKFVSIEEESNGIADLSGKETVCRRQEERRDSAGRVSPGAAAEGAVWRIVWLTVNILLK